MRRHWFALALLLGLAYLAWRAYATYGVDWWLPSHPPKRLA